MTADIVACRQELLVAAQEGEVLQAAHKKARKELRGMTTLLQQKDREVRKGELEREKLQTELVEAIRQRNAFHQLSLQHQATAAAKKSTSASIAPHSDTTLPPMKNRRCDLLPPNCVWTRNRALPPRKLRRNLLSCREN